MRLSSILLISLLILPLLFAKVALPAEASTSSHVMRIGPWLSNGGFENGWNATQVVQNVYLTKPYYAFTDYPLEGRIDGGKVQHLENFVAVMNEFMHVEHTDSSLGVVEITTTFSFDACSETDIYEPDFGLTFGGWNRFQEYVTAVNQYARASGGPIVSAGIWGEWLRCDGYSIADAHANGILTDSVAVNIFARAKNIIGNSSLAFISETFHEIPLLRIPINTAYAGSDNCYPNCPITGFTDTGLPVWSADNTFFGKLFGQYSWQPTIWDPAVNPNVRFNPVGMINGIKANYICCAGHPWNQTDIQQYFAYWHIQPSNFRYVTVIGCAIFPTCSLADNGIDFGNNGREWIWQEQQKYPEFVWVGKSSTQWPWPLTLLPIPPALLPYVILITSFMVGFLPFVLFNLARRRNKENATFVGPRATRRRIRMDAVVLALKLPRNSWTVE